MSRIKLTLINPELDFTVQDLKTNLTNVEVHIKEELYMIGAWRQLGYHTVQDFLEDNCYSIINKITCFIDKHPEY